MDVVAWILVILFMAVIVGNVLVSVIPAIKRRHTDD